MRSIFNNQPSHQIASEVLALNKVFNDSRSSSVANGNAENADRSIVNNPVTNNLGNIASGVGVSGSQTHQYNGLQTEIAAMGLLAWVAGIVSDHFPVSDNMTIERQLHGWIDKDSKNNNQLQQSAKDIEEWQVNLPEKHRLRSTLLYLQYHINQPYQVSWPGRDKQGPYKFQSRNSMVLAEIVSKLQIEKDEDLKIFCKLMYLHKDNYLQSTGSLFSTNFNSYLTAAMDMPPGLLDIYESENNESMEDTKQRMGHIFQQFHLKRIKIIEPYLKRDNPIEANKRALENKLIRNIEKMKVLKDTSKVKTEMKALDQIIWQNIDAKTAYGEEIKQTLKQYEGKYSIPTISSRQDPSIRP